MKCFNFGEQLLAKVMKLSALNDKLCVTDMADMGGRESAKMVKIPTDLHVYCQYKQVTKLILS